MSPENSCSSSTVDQRKVEVIYKGVKNGSRQYQLLEPTCHSTLQCTSAFSTVFYDHHCALSVEFAVPKADTWKALCKKPPDFFSILSSRILLCSLGNRLLICHSLHHFGIISKRFGTTSKLFGSAIQLNFWDLVCIGLKHDSSYRGTFVLT